MTPDELVAQLTSMGIRQKGDPILHQPAKPFDLPREREDAEALRNELLSYVPRLRALYTFSKGVGLAAPQIGIARAMAIVSPAPDKEALVLINPVVMSESHEQDNQYEGCLSFFNVRGRLRRPLSVRVQITLPSGHRESRTLTRGIARLALHEIDHLNGTLYSDRVPTDEPLVPLHKYSEADNEWRYHEPLDPDPMKPKAQSQNQAVEETGSGVYRNGRMDVWRVFGLIGVLVAIMGTSYTCGKDDGQSSSQQLRDRIDLLDHDTARLEAQNDDLAADNTNLREALVRGSGLGAAPEPGPSPIPPSAILALPVVDITSPDGAQPVPMEISVEGASQGLSEDREIWIVVAPDGTDFLYPQTGPALREPDGDWISHNVHLGGAGRTFAILAVVADRAASDQFKTYLATSTAGIRSLPAGALNLDHVTVFRN